MPKSPMLLEESFSFRHFANQLPNAVFCLGSDFRFLYLNDAACRQLEYSRQELISMKLSDIDPDFSQKNWLKQWLFLKQQKPLVIQSRHRTRSGKLLPVELTLNYVKDRDGDFSCVFVRKVETQPIHNPSLLDRNLDFDSASVSCNGSRNDNINDLYQKISYLKKKELQLTKTLSLVRGILDSTAYGTAAVSYEGEVLSQNQKFLEMWKIPDSLVSAKDTELCKSFFARQLKNPEVFSRSVWEISRESETETYDILELKDGRVFAQYSKPQRLNDKIIGRVWSIWDITELEQTKSELQKTQDKTEIQVIKEAEQLSELRSRFLSTICHQFRSSLNIISFSNGLLKRYASIWTDNKKLLYLDSIQTAIEQISLLLDELIFFGKSEVGQINLEPKPIDLAGFCRTLIAQMQPSLDNKQQTIEFVARCQCKTSWIDQNILHHILMNVLSNAIKYSPKGSKIEFEVLSEPEQAIIKIKDKGIGITEVDQQQLFDPFFRGSNVGGISGTGLGLSIVKNLVETHGGKIEVESKVGIGTSFSIALAVGSSSEVG